MMMNDQNVTDTAQTTFNKGYRAGYLFTKADHAGGPEPLDDLLCPDDDEGSAVWCAGWDSAIEDYANFLEMQGNV
jgi:hypothetical protein